MKIMISGASRGLGRALALDLSADSEVISFARGDAKESYKNITHISGIDVTDYDSLESLYDQLSECDALINNVGVAYDGILATQGIENIETLIQTNLLSVIYLTKLYVRARLSKRQGGNIVSISSIIGIRGYSGLSVYSATKAGLDGLTRSLARELGKRFRVNSVLPGYLETEMTSALSDKQRQQIIRRTPAGRLGKVEDVIPAVRFLMSDGAEFITGQSLVIDGGITV